MFSHSRRRAFWIAGALSFAATALSITMTEFFVHREIENLAAEKNLESRQFGNALHSHVDKELNALLFLSSGLRSYIKAYHATLDEAKLYEILAELHSDSKHVRNLGVAIGYRLSYVYPVKGNEKALGLDYQTLPVQLEKIQQAIIMKEGVLDGPLSLVQGGQALIYRYPVFIDNQYWGIVSTVIDTSSFFAAAFSEVQNRSYDFAIRKIDEAGGTGNAFYGEDSLFENSKAMLVTSSVPNGQWQWAILNHNEYKISSATLAIRLLGWMLSFVVGLVVYLLLRERSRLTKDALYDDLTGLANRRLLADRFEQNLSRLGRLSNHTCSVLLLDLNGFKRINDNFGHQAGDVVLQTVAHRITEQVRNGDTVARLGGDEYVMVLTHENEAVVLAKLEQRLRNAISQPIEFNGQILEVEASIGIATYPEDGKDLAGLMEKADSRMYDEKKNPASI